MSKEDSLPVEIREASVEDAPGIAWTHVESWRATYHGIVPQAYLDSLQVEEFEERWRTRLIDPSDMMVYVADHVGRVCGFASGGPARKQMSGFSGELYAIYVSPDACAKGIGSRLFWTIARKLSTSGHQGMYVWVLRENPSRGFYEHLGGTTLTACEIEIGGKSLEELSYGWPDLGAAVNSASFH
jgi:GNAT superfamily N-acetyltransferase